MQIDTFGLLLSGIVFFIYGSICILSLIFTFSLDIYCKIEEKLRLDIFSGHILNPLKRNNIDWFDFWLMEHNKIAGPLLTLLSIVDLKLWFVIINTL